MICGNQTGSFAGGSPATLQGEIGLKPFLGAAIYLKRLDHQPPAVQGREKGREERTSSEALHLARGLTHDLPGGVGSRRDEARSAGEGTAPRGSMAQSGEPREPRTRRMAGDLAAMAWSAPLRGAESTAGRWWRGARRLVEGAPAPPGEPGAPLAHLREGTPPGGGGAGVRGGSDSQPALSSQEAAHYPASLKSN